MDIQITSHPTARPCVYVGEIVNFEVIGSDTVSVDPETYQWVQDGEDIAAATSSTYAHTAVTVDYGTKIQCNISGRLSNAVELLPLEIGVSTSFARSPFPYAYVAGGTATLAFIPVGVNMTYSVFDPTGTLVAGPTACFNGYTSVFTSGVDPVIGLYRVEVTGDGGIASVSANIRLFEDQLVLFPGKSSYHKFGSLVSEVGYNDVGFRIQFGQIERNTWLIQQFTGDTNGDVIMRLDNSNELPGQPATVEVVADGQFRAVLNWDPAAGHYIRNDLVFADHLVGRNRYTYDPDTGLDIGDGEGDAVVLDFAATVADSLSLDVAKGGALGDYKYGASAIVDVPFGAITGTVTGFIVDEILVDDPDGQTTTKIHVKINDPVFLPDPKNMEVAVVETGQVAQLSYINFIGSKDGVPAPATGLHYYEGVCDTSSGLDNDIGRSLKDAAEASGTPASGTVVPTLVLDANTVDSVTVDAGGSGYTAAPVVTFSTGTGSTATGTAVLTGDVVTSVTVDTPGSYLDAELPITVTIAAPIISSTVTFDVRLLS